MKVLSGDIETNGLLDELTKLHCAVFYNHSTNEFREFTDINKLGEFLKEHKSFKLAIHNGICFDKPALEKLGLKVENEVIDTLGISYYLNLNSPKHGLAYHGERLGIAKPRVDDWEDQPLEVYLERCKEDVKIQAALWDEMWPRMLEIYESEKDAIRMIRYLNWKMEQQRIQENNKIKLDTHKALELLSTLEALKKEKTTELESVMPKVPVKKVRVKPKVMFKSNGDPSALNIKWHEFLDEQGVPKEEQGSIEEYEYIADYKEPNAGSHQQVKDWLFSLGWKPETFKKVKDDKDPVELEAERLAAKEEAKRKSKFSKKKVRAKWVTPYTVRHIPQILTEDKDICPSIVKLAKQVPEVKSLEGLDVINHRIGMVNGLLEAANSRGGYVQARCHAFTNTLRLKHAELVNIPSSRKAWGNEIRALLLAEEGQVLLGSDLSSLEDRLRQHYQWPLDPEYVKTQMAPDFDGHLLNAVAAGLMNSSEMSWYKSNKDNEELNKSDRDNIKRLSGIRHIGKAVSYSAQYGAGAKTIAESAGVDEELGEVLHKAYWDLNWSVKAIAEGTTVKEDSSGQKWQLNPINGFWYHLKTDKDRFSTLVQGSGSYVFDMWLYFQNQACLEKFGKELPLAAQFHDEQVVILKDSESAKKVMKKVAKDAISMLNSKLKLNRDMDIDVQFGHNYSEIH